MSSEQFPPNADEVRLRLIVQLLNQWETELAEWQNQSGEVFPVALQLLSRNPEQCSSLPGDQLPTCHLSSMVERHRLCELLSEFGPVSQGSELQRLADKFVEFSVGLEMTGLARKAPEKREFLTIEMGVFPESIKEEAGLFIELSACVSALLAVVRDLQKVLVVQVAPAAGSGRPEAVDPEIDVIIAHGNGCYSIGRNQPLSVDPGEHDVLTAFLDLPAMPEETLKRKSGVPRARDVLKNLRTKYDGQFAPAISMPGGKGKGGYRVSIRRAE